MAQIPTAPDVLDTMPPPEGTVADDRTDLSAVRGNLFDGEQIDGVFRGGDTGPRLVVTTNRRLMLVESETWAGRMALTSVLYRQVSCLSLLAPDGGPLAAATTIGIKVAGTMHEVSCHDEAQARELHDLILWQLLG